MDEHLNNQTTCIRHPQYVQTTSTIRQHITFQTQLLCIDERLSSTHNHKPAVSCLIRVYSPFQNSCGLSALFQGCWRPLPLVVEVAIEAAYRHRIWESKTADFVDITVQQLTVQKHSLSLPVPASQQQLLKATLQAESVISGCV